MKKREQGILTVEASIVLTLFMLFVLFIFSFARIYSAQNIVSHATIQTSDDMALESYLRENARDDKAQDVVYLASRLTGATTLSEDNFKSLQVTDIPSLAREKFIAAISSSESEADEILKNFGVKDGISGIDFSASTLDDQKENVIVSVSYTLKVQFPIFGGNEISVTKTSKSKTFGKVLNELSVVPNNPLMGSAAGSGNYPDGQVVQISASPHYGYKFVKWADDNTNNPRSITVNGAQKFTAIFAEDGFGVTLECNPTGAGQLSGASRYEYMSSATISQTANSGYTFKNWTVFSHRDKTTHTETSQSVSRTMDQSYTFTANYNSNPYDISVESEGYNANVSVTQTDDTSNSGKRITVLFGEKITLSAPSVTGYIFKGWKKKNTSSYLTTNYSTTINVPPENTTYVAVYEIQPWIKISGGSSGGKSTRFYAETFPSQVTVNWSSSNSGVASVSGGTVTALYPGNATITAKFQYNGKWYSATRNINISETQYSMVYCMYQTGGNKNFLRHYSNVHQPNNSTNHHCFTIDSLTYTRITVNQSWLDSSPKIYPKGMATGIKYSGKNESDVTGYVINERLYFITGQTGPGGYFIGSIY